MFLAESAPDLMQRLSRLPSAPDVTLLGRRKPKPFSWLHTTPPLESRLTSDGVASTYRMHPPYRTSPYMTIPSLGSPLAVLASRVFVQSAASYSLCSTPLITLLLPFLH